MTEFLKSKGADLVGFADMRSIAWGDANELFYAISIGVALDPEVVSQIREGPTRQYYAEYRRANYLLDSLGDCAVQFLDEHGCQSKAFPATGAIGVAPETLVTTFPHKTPATRAGLGWIGKCALLVTEPFGSAVRITTVLTDAKLPTGIPTDESQCGDCNTCVTMCPGHAPSGVNWKVDLYRDSFFDPHSCLKMAIELARERTGIRTDETFCGVCMAVCPWTRKYIDRSTQPDTAADADKPRR